MNPETSLDSWLSEHYPQITTHCLTDLPTDELIALAVFVSANLHTLSPVLKESFASYLAAQMEGDPSTREQQVTLRLLKRLELRVH